MALRSERLAKFTSDVSPDIGQPVTLLCEDHVGTYVLPFACVWDGTFWRNAQTQEVLSARVMGWAEVLQDRAPPAQPRPGLQPRNV